MTMTATMTPEMSRLKTRLKTAWESGDYGVFARSTWRKARLSSSSLEHCHGNSTPQCRVRRGPADASYGEEEDSGHGSRPRGEPGAAGSSQGSRRGTEDSK